MPTHRKLQEFDQSQESWRSYTEQLAHYYTTNETPAAKKKSILLTIVGPSTYALAKNLCQLDKLDKKPMTK